jgi:serine/threonine protein kinase
VSALKICPQCGTEYELDQRFCPKDGSTLKSQNAAGDLVGTIIADRYHVLRKLGEGGMGTVYLAEHVKMGRKSAVKVMNPGMVHDADAISRFNREAANASKINHANVAAVYDFGETSDGVIYLAMEFVEGPPLTKIIEESGALPPLRAADIARQAAEALAVAHDMGIVHRDLKPDNIMLTKNRDGTDCVKVVDFGIAKVANNDAQKVTRTGLVVGTPEYMSPEQLAGDKLDGRSDIYSLGLVSFAMLTGKLPFPGETLQESMIARLTDEPARLVEMKADVNWPASVQTVMDKALQRDAELRYASANEFGRDLFAAIAAMPESAATNAFTAVMNKLSTPEKASAAVPSSPSSPRASATRTLPPTRVSRASSRDIPAPAPEKRRTSRAYLGVFGMIGFVAIAVSMWAIGKFGGQGTRSRSSETNDAGGNVASQSTAIIDPTVALSRELERITPLTEDSVTADSALVRMSVLDSLAEVAADSSRLQLRFLRGKALLNVGRQDAGCDTLSAIEGPLRNSGSRFYRADSAFLTNVCQP